LSGRRIDGGLRVRLYSRAPFSGDVRRHPLVLLVRPTRCPPSLERRVRTLETGPKSYSKATIVAAMLVRLPRTPPRRGGEREALRVQNSIVFDIGHRGRVRDLVLDIASSDPRVVAGAVFGSLAHDEGDQWSDLDLMFAVADEVPVSEVLEAWTTTVVREFRAVQLFDLPSGPIIYRVFLLPHGLELDLSFTRASDFRASGPTFRLLFGVAVEEPDELPTPANELFGYAVHHTLHARVAIERGRYWQAEYWISAVRDRALALACRRLGLDGWYGRDFDRLPADILVPVNDALVRSLEPDELDRALGSAVAALLRESAQVGEMADKVEAQLRKLASGYIS
jgi:hypothetical protein